MADEHPVADPSAEPDMNGLPAMAHDQPAISPIAPDGAAEARRLFLESRDVPCPNCRYNLRGVTSEACPECGEPIELQLGGSRRHWVPPVFMALAFAWLMIAGGMNATRNGVIAWDAAYQPAMPTWSFYTNRATITGGSTLSGTFQSGVTIQVGPNGTTTTRVLQGTPIAASTGPVWSNVAGITWVRLGWSSFLVIAGLLGLVILWRHRRRPLSARAWARARLFALLAFGIYGGFHLYWFAIEFM